MGGSDIMVVWQDSYKSVCNAPLVSVTEFDLDPFHPGLEFLAYWRSLNGGETPRRSSFSPQNIPSLLKWLMMFRREMVADDDLYFLYLQGNSAAELTDGLQQGTYLHDFTKQQCFDTRRAVLRGVLESGQPAFANILVGEKGADFTTTISVGAFPFLNEGGQPEVVMVPAPQSPELRLYL